MMVVVGEAGVKMVTGTRLDLHIHSSKQIKGNRQLKFRQEIEDRIEGLQDATSIYLQVHHQLRSMQQRLSPVRRVNPHSLHRGQGW